MGFGHSSSSSSPVTVSPFGGLPYKEARLARQEFSSPLSRGFGYGGGGGPLASFINQGTGVTGSYIPQMQDLSKIIEGGANSAYGGYENAVNRFMSQLPGMQANAAQATGYARTAAEDAFSPLPGRATFQEASRRALSAARPGEAARGMLDSGQAQAGEQSILSDLAFNALQNENATRQAAIQGLSGATQGEAGLATLGPQMQQQLFSAYPQLAQLLQGARELPMNAVNNLLSFFTSAQNPTFSLLRMILPQVAQVSSSSSQSGGFGGG